MKIITPYAEIINFDPDEDLIEIVEFDEGFIVAIDDEFISPKFLFKPMEGEQWSKCVIMCEDKFDASEKVQVYASAILNVMSYNPYFISCEIDGITMDSQTEKAYFGD